MKATDLREKSQDDLRELEKSLARDVFQNRLKNFTNRLDDTSAMRKARRDLARVKTLLRETALGLVRQVGEKSAEAPAAKPAKAEAPAEAAAPAKKAAKKAAPKAEAESKPKKAPAKKKASTESEAK